MFLLQVASLQEEIQILGTQIANFLTTGAAISAVENPFIEMNDYDFGMNSNHSQNQLLPYQTSDGVQKDDQMISPLLCLGEKDGGFGFCHSNHVVERSGFDVSVEENFGGYPWILG